MSKLIVALVYLGLTFYVYNYLATNEVIPEHRDFASFPSDIESWHCSEQGGMDEATLRNLGATDYLICSYRSDRGPGETVHTYVGFHETQVRKEGGGAGENSIHPPEHCIPGSGWDVIDSRIVSLDLPGLPDGRLGGREAKRFVIAKGNARQLVYFWYQSRGRVVARNHEVILFRVWDRAVHQRTDGALVRLTVPIVNGDEAAAERVLLDFASEFAPILPEYLPQ